MKTRAYFLLLSAIALGGTNLLSQDAPDPFGGPITKPKEATPAPPKESNATEPAVPVQTANELRAVIRTNIHAWNTENLVLLRSTTHNEAPLLETSDMMARHIFDRLTLKYTVTKLTALKADEEEALVEVHQKTEKVDGAVAFRNNQAQIIHTLKKENGKWKMWSSKLKVLQFLE